jgi:hypothetical protein
VSLFTRDPAGHKDKRINVQITCFNWRIWKLISMEFILLSYKDMNIWKPLLPSQASTYGVSFKPFLIGFNSLRSFNFGWSELFGGQGVFWFI